MTKGIPHNQGKTIHEMRRRTFLRAIGVGAGAALATPSLSSTAAAATPQSGAGSHHTEGFADFVADPPFSFTYDGQPSSVLLAKWPHSVRSVSSTRERVERWITWSDPQTRLRVRAEVVIYPDFDAVEWTVYFTNSGRAASAVLADVLGADTSLHPDTTAQCTLHHFNGSTAQADDYAPQDTPVQTGERQLLYPNGGRPSNGTWPYFNVDWGDEGVMVAVGWPGQWCAQLLREAAHGLGLKAGMTSLDPAQQAYTDIGTAQLLNTTLRPGEEVRTPLIVLMTWQAKSWMLAQNKWRRWMSEHNMPRFGGSRPVPIIPTTGSLGLAPTQAQEFAAIDACVQERATKDRGGFYTHWWVDAGWYAFSDTAQPDWFSSAGNWYPDPTRFPDGMVPTFSRAKKHGMKSILWSEPERAMPHTWLADHHPEWLIGQTGVAPDDQVFLLDFGNPQAQRWAIEHFDHLIKTQGAHAKGLDVFRQDFNMYPLAYWNTADDAARSGMTQMKHVVGHLAFWDELHRRHPGMWIDSCASGGRRNDLESMRRAVPLLRSDYQFEPTGNQSHTYGISFWLPYYGTGVGPQSAHNGDWGSEQYVVRSSLAPCYASSLDAETASDEQWDVLRKMNEDFLEIKDDLLYSDFYPLTAFSLEGNVWMALQYHRPEVGSGVILAFRRPQAAAATKEFRLQGLKSRANYLVENLDGGHGQKLSGQTLASRGVTVSLPTAPAAAIIRYRELGGA